MTAYVTESVNISRDHYLLVFDAPHMEPSSPGQFVNIRISPATDPLVRRPFSVFSHEKNKIEIVVKSVGRGTGSISSFRPGEPVDLLGPLGRGFTVRPNARALLVGGGVGNAPLYYLAWRLKSHGTAITYLYCSRSREYQFLLERFAETVDRLVIATDDGTAGVKGLAPEIAAEVIREEGFEMVCTCGPTPMMEGMVNVSKNAGVPIEVSLENYFGCGIGLCSGCTVETVDGNKRACVDGPVMDGKSILWNTMPV